MSAVLGLVALYLVAINVLAFGAFAIDKRAARTVGARRLPERNLLRLAAAGGSIGAVVGQRWLRHKTYKQPFRTYLLLIVVAQVLLAIALIAWWFLAP